MSDRQPFVQSRDGTDIMVAQYGEGRPLVIVHGGMGEAAHWDPVGKLLSPPYRIVGIERRVYGRSGVPQSPHAVAREAEDIAAVLDRLGEPAIVIGHSSGAVVSLEAALLHPQNLKGLVLYEPPVQLDTPLGGDHQRLAEDALARGDADTAQLIFFRDIVGLSDPMVERMRSPMWRGGWEYMMTIMPRQMEDNRGLRALPLGIERYRAIEVPVLLLRGTDSPQHLQDRLAAVAAVLPAATVVDLPGEGHNANVSSPQMVADAIKAFAARVFR